MLFDHCEGMYNFLGLTEDVTVRLGWTYCVTVGTPPEKSADRPPVPAALQTLKRTQ